MTAPVAAERRRMHHGIQLICKIILRQPLSISAVYRLKKDSFSMKVLRNQRFSPSFAAFSMLRMVCKYSSSTGERFCA